jgi:hypothetical protein
MTFSPAKADTPLIVDADTVLTAAPTFELLQPVRRRYSEIGKRARCVKNQQLAECHSLNTGKLLGVPPFEDFLRLLAAELPDHDLIITRRGNTVKRYQVVKRVAHHLRAGLARPWLVTNYRSAANLRGAYAR